MVYDPETVRGRYRALCEPSPDGEKVTCSLLVDGLPPVDSTQCELLGCGAHCLGLVTVARAAMAKRAP
jgi:hypothetical protein